MDNKYKIGLKTLLEFACSNQKEYEIQLKYQSYYELQSMCKIARWLIDVLRHRQQVDSFLKTKQELFKLKITHM